MWQSHSVHQSSPSSDAIAGATKLQFNRRELDQAAAAQRAAGEAITYNELESKYSQLIVKFLSEITQECNKSVARMRHRVATHTCKLSHLLRD
jgi:phosphoribulokinase